MRSNEFWATFSVFFYILAQHNITSLDGAILSVGTTSQYKQGKLVRTALIYLSE